MTTRVKDWMKHNLVFFGPGLLLAITAAGEAGITEAIEIGAHYQFQLIWVVIITLLFKYAFTTGIARYTLATGKTIFEGLCHLPGPKHWGGLFTIGCFIAEALSLGAMILFAATFLDYILSGAYRYSLVAVFILVLALLLLRTHIYHKFELIMAVIIFIIAISMVVILANMPFTGEMVINGLIPHVPSGSETAVLAIIGVVGSGLNLMLYSVWLEKKIQSKNEGEASRSCELNSKYSFRRYLRSVKVDIAVGFIIVALVTIGFMALGCAGFLLSFMPHGESELTLDALITQVSYLFNSIPFGVYVFMGFVALIFFGSVVVGLDASASAVTKIIKQMKADNGKPVKNSSIIYTAALGVFAAVILLAFIINDPLGTIRLISSTCAVLFGIFGFILLYLNSKLPAYARGSRLWMLLIGVGSVLSIFITFRLEGTFFDSGLPMMKEVLLCLVIMYIFTRTKMCKRFIDGTANIADKFWLICIFGVISIYGTYSGIRMGGYIINFRDLGVMAAGLLGGPVVGVITGFIGGLFRLSQGGATAVPCFIATILAGLISGISIRIWKGRHKMLGVFSLSVGVELLHILFVFPMYAMITGSMDLGKIVDVIISTLIPMVLVNTAGLMCFTYFLIDKEVWLGGLKKITLSGIASEFKQLFKTNDDDDVTENRGKT